MITLLTWVAHTSITFGAQKEINIRVISYGSYDLHFVDKSDLHSQTFYLRRGKENQPLCLPIL